jgi:hypothetical protein
MGLKDHGSNITNPKVSCHILFYSNLLAIRPKSYTSGTADILNKVVLLPAAGAITNDTYKPRIEGAT